MSNRILDHILDSPENNIDLQVGADMMTQALHTALPARSTVLSVNQLGWLSRVSLWQENRVCRAAANTRSQVGVTLQTCCAGSGMHCLG
jgi:hypothetical protein